jgi:senataxin
MDNHAIYQAALDWHREFEDRPPEAHLCCPKINDNDNVNYDEPDVPEEGEGGATVEQKKERIKDYDARFNNTYNLAILLGLGKEVAGEWLDNWEQAVESCLRGCDACARNWHRNRAHYLNGL